MPEHNPLNFCRPCGQDFGSVKLFDWHRVGVHAYTYDEGLRMTPARQNGRRCLTVEELRDKGWQLDARERWRDPARTADVTQRMAAPN